MSRYGYIKHSDVELSHHGILGQKWGVRRYQNEDGSLTEAGKKRYLNSNGYLKANAYSEKFINRNGLFKEPEGININKYQEYTNKQKQIKYENVKRSIKNFDNKVSSSVKQLIKIAKNNGDEYYDGTPLIGWNEIDDLINENFPKVSKEQYNVIYDSIEDQLNKKGIGYWD